MVAGMPGVRAFALSGGWVGITGLDRERVTRAAPLIASLALHVALVGFAAVLVPRASARLLDSIAVELVAVEPPRVVEAPPAPPAPPKRVTPPKPTAPPLPKIEPKATPPSREPEPAPVAPPTAASPPDTTPAPSAAPSTPPASSAPLAPGVSWVDTTPSAPATSGRSSTPVAAVPRDAGITQVARPTGGYQVWPSYPSSARRLNIQGTTLLRVHVLADGRIGEVNVEESAGHRDLDQAASNAVRRWRFEPARRGDEAVAMWVRVPVEFKLRNAP